MTRLILTTSDSGGGALKAAGIADIVIPFEVRLVWGPPPSDAELAHLLAAPSAERRPVSQWLDCLSQRHREEIEPKGVGLIEFCAQCGSAELWIDPVPNAQLTLIWLLDRFRSHREAASKLKLRQSDLVLGGQSPESLAKSPPVAVEISDDHLDAAALAWHAYRASTPKAWSDLLSRDLSALPQLRSTVLALLEELPMPATGLGATEMRLLELIADGCTHPGDLFPDHQKRNTRRVFGYWEVGALVDGLARGSVPAISGLAEGPFTLEMHEDASRHRRYKQSRLSLTALGEAILAQADDFSRHNPIHRWWGGTELTNEHLWRWTRSTARCSRLEALRPPIDILRSLCPGSTRQNPSSSSLLLDGCASQARAR